jgi:hypothetical protein
MVAIMVFGLHLLFRFVVADTIGTIVLSSLIAHTAWHWTGNRWDRLRQFGWPTVDVSTIATLVRGLTVLVAIAAATWVMATLVTHSRVTRDPGTRASKSLVPSEPVHMSADVPASTECGYTRVEGPAPSEREYMRVEG